MPARTVFPASSVLRAISLVVPAWRRAEWVAEWRGEVEHAWRASQREGRPGGLTRLQLTLRAVDSLPDALWLRRRDRGGDGWGWIVRNAFRSLAQRVPEPAHIEGLARWPPARKRRGGSREFSDVESIRAGVITAVGCLSQLDDVFSRFRRANRAEAVLEE